MEKPAVLCRRIVTALAVLALTFAGAVAQPVVVHASPTSTVRPVDVHATEGENQVFDPGLIISDYNFYNSDAMTPGEIQRFLASRNCSPRDGSPCLTHYRQDTMSQPAQGSGHCATYRGSRDERASRIIARVADACGISPKVLLVLLQKEQSLLTRPSAPGYLRATGYGCPDTADCNAEYFGFFNQVYNAAWQFRQYTQEPERAYRIGLVDIRFNPDAACGSSLVEIRNQATANLYNYTPYQPNQAALAEQKSSRDVCSAHGNLNFWTLYNRWFGSPTSTRYPMLFDDCLNLTGGQPCRPSELIPSLQPTGPLRESTH